MGKVRMSTKEKVYNFFVILFVVVIGLLIGGIIAMPMIMKFELMDAATNYLNRH